jgi:outer membrane lipase/esterase
MQDIEAHYSQSLIVAPSQISMLSESAIQNRSNLIGTFHQQIPLAFQKSPGLQMWLAGDVSDSSMSQSTGFPNNSGTPSAATLGLGFRNRPEWTFGGAVSSIIGTQNYSSGGQYSSNEFVLSAYAGYESEQLWANGVISYGEAAIDSSRIFSLGVTSQGNYGSVSGSNSSLSTETGYKFMSSLGVIDVEHSPVLGIAFQNSYIKEFSERNPSGAPTSLSFGSQDRNSTISKIGYQANMQLGAWKPFARISWYEELADTNRNITTSLNSITAPSYTMPAVQLGSHWTQGQVGVHYKFSSTISGYVLINGQYSQENASNSSGSVALNISL